MKTIIGNNTYETTHRNGMPAIRKLNYAGNTSRWIDLRSELGLRVMRQLDLEPAMAPGFSTQPEKEQS